MQTIELRGTERLLACSPDVNFKVAHAMTVQGPVEPLLSRLPQAITNTFNKHPRMRIKQSPNRILHAHVFPFVTLQEITTEFFQVLYQINDDDWKQMVIDECDQPYDRSAKFPCYLHALVNPMNSEELKLVLYSEHYQSDGISGFVIFDSILQEASRPSALPIQSRLMPPSLFDLRAVWTNPTSISAYTRANLYAKQIFAKMTHSSAQKRPQQQKHPEDNSEASLSEHLSYKKTGRFVTGRKENLEKALARCRQEGVTLNGAFCAALATIWAELSENPLDKTDDSAVKLHLSFLFNLRSHVDDALQGDDVGSYAHRGTLESMMTKGFRRDQMFWDLARHAKVETQEAIAGAKPLFDFYLFDEFGKLLADSNVKMSLSASSDIQLSNVGRYRFPFSHKVPKAAGGGSWRIKSIHECCETVRLSKCFKLWITSVDSLNYSMLHRADNSQASCFFENVIKCFEAIGSIGSQDTIEQVIQHKLVSTHCY